MYYKRAQRTTIIKTEMLTTHIDHDTKLAFTCERLAWI